MCKIFLEEIKSNDFYPSSTGKTAPVELFKPSTDIFSLLLLWNDGLVFGKPVNGLGPPLTSVLPLPT